MNLFFAGTGDFTVATPMIQLFPGQQTIHVNFTLEIDAVSQEPPETFQIVAEVSTIRYLQPNEFLRLTKRVTIIDRTRKHVVKQVRQHTCIL